MILLINTASTFKGGSTQVARSFLEECKQFKKHEYHVVLGTSIAGILATASFPENFTFYSINFRPATRVFSLKSTSSFLKEIEFNSKPDVVFTTSGPAYWRYVYSDSPFWSTLSLTKRVKWKFKRQLIRHFSNNIAKDFKEFIKIAGMTHVRTAPYYSQSIGEIERYHKTIKSECIRKEVLLSLNDAREVVDGLVKHYNTVRPHSSIGYTTPDGKLHGREKKNRNHVHYLTSH